MFQEKVDVENENASISQGFISKETGEESDKKEKLPSA